MARESTGTRGAGPGRNTEFGCYLCARQNGGEKGSNALLTQKVAGNGESSEVVVSR